MCWRCVARARGRGARRSFRFPLAGPWFPTPWQPVSPSHRAVAWRPLPPVLPLSVTFALRPPVPARPISSLALTPRPISYRLSFPLSSNVYTPTGRQQPCGAEPLDPDPSGDRLLPLVPIFSPMSVLMPRPSILTLGFWPTRAPRLLVPVLSCVPSLMPCLYFTGPPANQWRWPKGLFCAPARVSLICTPTFALISIFFFRVLLPPVRTPSAAPPPTPRLCCLPCGVLLFFFGFVVTLFFLFFVTLLPACTHDTPAPDICGDRSSLVSSLVLSPPLGFHCGGPRSCRVGAPPLHLPLSAPAPPPSHAPCPSPPYCSSPASRAPSCSSQRHGCIFLATRAAPSAPRSSPGRLTWAALPSTPFGGIPPASVPAALSSISSLMEGRGSWYGSLTCCRSVGDVVPIPDACCPPCATLHVFFCAPCFFPCPSPVVPRVPSLLLLARALRVSPAPCCCGPALLPQPLSLCLLLSPPSTTLTPRPYPVIYRVLLDLRHPSPSSPSLPCHLDLEWCCRKFTVRFPCVVHCSDQTTRGCQGCGRPLRSANTPPTGTEAHSHFFAPPKLGALTQEQQQGVLCPFEAQGSRPLEKRLLAEVGPGRPPPEAGWEASPSTGQPIPRGSRAFPTGRPDSLALGATTSSEGTQLGYCFSLAAFALLTSSVQSK